MVISSTMRYNKFCSTLVLPRFNPAAIMAAIGASVVAAGRFDPVLLLSRTSLGYFQRYLQQSF
jgi:hypothetical protein